MTDDSAKDTPVSGDGKAVVRGHLRVIPTVDTGQEAITVDAAPDGMAGVDVASMFTQAYEMPAPTTGPTPETAAGEGEGGSQQDGALAEALEVDPVDDTVPSAPSYPSFEQDTTDAQAPVLASGGRGGILPPESETLAGAENPGGDLDAFELAYADGSTAPATEKRGLFRKSRGRDHEHDPQPQAVLAQAHADVWAAHRDSEWHTDEPPVMPSAPTFLDESTAAPRTSSPRRGRRLTLAVVLAALLLGLGVLAVELLGGSGAKPKASHTAKHHAPTQTITVTTPAQTVASSTATTTTPVKHHARRDHKERRVVKPHKTATVTRPVATTPAATTPAYTTPAHTTAPVTTAAPTVTKQNTSTPTTATRHSTGSSSSTSGGTAAGGLPNAQQVSRFPGS